MTTPTPSISMEAVLRETLAKVVLETTATSDIDFTQRGEAIMDRLERRMANPGYLRGISTGVQGIDYVTGGLQPEQFIVVIGLPKAMKSSTLLWMAKNIHDAGKRPLFIGFEMSNDEQEDRLTSLYGAVGLTAVMNGTLSLNDRRAIRAQMDDPRQERHAVRLLGGHGQRYDSVGDPLQDPGVPTPLRADRRRLPDAERATEG